MNKPRENSWIADLMGLGGFIPRFAQMPMNDSPHSKHTKKRNKKLRGRELKRREAQSRSMRRKGGRR